MTDRNRFTPLVGTLVYVWDRAADAVLMIRRNARIDDDHFGKVNGVGGKVEVDEDLVTSAARELYEEASLVPTEWSLRGTITFTNFGPKREQWLVAVFLVTMWEGDIPTLNEEGTLEWVDRRDLLDACSLGPAAEALPMWPGDRHFVPLVFDDDDRAFHATLPYDGDHPLGWSHVRL